MQTAAYRRRAGTPFIPTLPMQDQALGYLFGSLTTPERRALAEIVECADTLFVDGRPWLLIPASDALLDRLAAFAAELQDLEYETGDDEPLHDEEHDLAGDGHGGGFEQEDAA
jgi:hypothetical protein